MPKRQILYLVLAAVGLVSTWYHNLSFVAVTGSLSPADFVAAAFANHAASSLGWDVCVACAAFLTFVSTESRRLGLKHVWLYYVLALAVAFAFAGPLFLFVRERAMRRAETR